MPTAAQNVTVVAGDTVELDFTAYGPDGVTALDLSGATIAWRMARYPGDAAAAVLAKATGDGITITNSTGGQFKVTLSAADTASVAKGRYYHAAIVTDAGNNISTIASGFVVIRPKVR